jgi:hypothetical protein
MGQRQDEQGGRAMSTAKKRPPISNIEDPTSSAYNPAACTSTVSATTSADY